MAARCKLSPYLPSRPMNAAERVLFDQYRPLAYHRVNAALKRYGHHPRNLLETAGLIGLMYATVQYETPSAASFHTFATRTIDWTIRNVVQHDAGYRRKKPERPPVNRPQERFEPSAYRAAGDLPEVFFDTLEDQHVLVDGSTPEQALADQQRLQSAHRILASLELEVNGRMLAMLKRKLDGEPLASIGRSYGVSRERARQIVEKALKRAARIAARAA